MADPLIVYTLANCDTCRKATRWLRARNVAFEERPIRVTPPSLAHLRAMLTFTGGDLRALFNTAGAEFRALGLKDKLPALSEADALNLLASNGSLVKRPFAIGAHAGAVGFDEERWRRFVGSEP